MKVFPMNFKAIMILEMVVMDCKNDFYNLITGGDVSSLLYATPPPPSRSGPKAPRGV